MYHPPHTATIIAIVDAICHPIAIFLFINKISIKEFFDISSYVNIWLKKVINISNNVEK